MDLKKGLLIAGGALVLVFSSLYIKNSIQIKKIPLVAKESIERILKILRKKKYRIYKYIATITINLQQQMKGMTINRQMIEQFINGPESPIKVNEEMQKILQETCTQNGLSIVQYQVSLQKFKDQEIIKMLIEQDENDYKVSLTGKLPSFNVTIPEHLTKNKFYQLQNNITKKAYIQQTKIFKKLKQYSHEQIQQNPSLLHDLGDNQQETQQLLRSQELQGQFWPASAVFEAANARYRNDADFRANIKKIQQFYEKILKKYVYKIQSKTIKDSQLNEMEDQILFSNPQQL